jgi:hypothetical protein
MEYEEALLKNERRELCRIHAEKLKAIDAHLQKIDHTLTGNGAPENGLLWIAKENKRAIAYIIRVSLTILGFVGLNFATRVLPSIWDLVAHGKFS